jgi:hypothetical protein
VSGATTGSGASTLAGFIFNKGTSTVTWKVTDASSNTATCSFTITVSDVQNPVITCVGNQVRNTNLNLCTYATVGTEFNPASFADNCTGSTTAYVVSGATTGSGASTLAGFIFNKGTNTVTWNVTDASSNTATCSFTVTINDVQVPVITCPSNITVNYNATQCGAIVNYSVTATDNCSYIITRTTGPASGSTFSLGTTTITHTAADPSGNSSSCTFTVTVIPLVTVSTVTVNTGVAQYSDKVTFTATITGGASQCSGPNAAATVTFKVGTQTMGTVAMVPSGANLVGTLVDIPLVEPSPFGTAPTGQMSPGIKTITATFNSINANFTVTNNPTTTLTINKEHARAAYTGIQILATASSSTSTANVVLSANIIDIAVPQSPTDPNYDPSAGDIRNAKMKFVNRDNNTDITGWIAVSTLVNATDPKIGTVSYTWVVNLGSATDVETTVGIIVDNGYYIRNSADDNVVVTVYKPVGDFITGGGHIMPTSSIGTYASQAGTKTNFGFNVKYNKSGTNLQGNMNVVFRRTESDAIMHVYQVKVNSMQSLGVNISNPNVQISQYVAKANLKDITNPLAPVSLGGNLGLYVTMTDRGEPGANDSVSIALTSSYGLSPTVLANLLYSSNWVSSMTKQIGLAGGNLVVHSGFSLRVDGQPEEVSNVPTGMLSVNYPNPFSGTTTIMFAVPNSEHTTLNVFNSLGQLVRTLFNEKAEAGTTYKVEFDSGNLPGGIYFYTINNESMKETKKMQVIK